jgi:phosphoribosylglycinamide formyltransferase-1
MAIPRITVLISGRGSNLAALLDAERQGSLGGAVSAVISNRARAAGLAIAQRHGIAAEVVDARAFAEREGCDAALAAAVDASEPDLVVLAGFMRILGADFVRRFDGRLVNIHPSLLPAFPGLQTHRRAIEAGCKASGASVHFVTAELDHGPLIAQAVVPVLAGDDDAALSARVLAQEHRLYPRAIAWLVAGRLERAGGLVRHRDGVSQLLLPDEAAG